MDAQQFKERTKEINIINWHAEDEDFSRYCIYGFGKTINGANCTIKINNYYPEMYIRFINKSDKDSNNFMKELEEDKEGLLNKLLDSINYICGKKLSCKENTDNLSESSKSSNDSLSKNKNDDYCCLEHNPHNIFTQPLPIKKKSIIKKYCKIEHKKDLYEKYGHNDIIVLKIVFSTQMAFNRLKKLLKHKITSFDGITKKNNYIRIDNSLLYKEKNYKIYTYKSDLPPLLDFFHKKNIQPCGWVKINNYKKIENNNKYADKNFYEGDFKNIEKIDKLDYAPFKIMSWDIEADSSHGDFPLAKKEFKKLTMEIADFYLKFIKNNKDKQDDYLFYNIFTYILVIAFSLEKYNNDINIKLDKAIQIQIKSAINKVYLKTELNYVHIEKIKDIEFIQRIYNICKNNKVSKLHTINEENLSLYLNNTQIIEDDEIDEEEFNKDKKKLSNRDIIIEKLNIIFKKEFREVQGDRIIQIGCVFHLFGKKEKNTKYILTLGSCDKIEDTKVYSFAKKKKITSYSNDELNIEEEKLIMKFQDIINKEQPNIILGYNTFGFDNKFLYNRCEELYIDENFGYIGKLKKKKTILTTKQLSSAALGDNILNILPTVGRTEIDLLKLIQREHNLDSYSLNNVSSVFIGDKKDDVTPKQIFEFQRQTSAKRAIIAKYCIKDCVLLIDLMNKLDKLSANIGMANVCSVPLEFIILRGQGIKVQSLVSKECNLENYILRELQKKNNDSSYEGAIVLEPKKGMYLEDPVAVLDYASLYPSSMIASNISHEVIVKTDFYKDGNLEEIEELNLENMKDGIHFKNTEKYKELIEDFDIKAYENEIKSYNKFPLLDSIYLQTLKYRFIRKCKCKLYIAEKFYENMDDEDFDIDKYKLEYDKLSREQKTNYNRNVYYPYNPKLDKLEDNENIDNVNYISISFDTYTGKKDKKEKDGVKKITLAHPCDIEKYDNTDEYPDQTISNRGIMPKILRKLLKARKDTKKKIPLEKDEFKKGVLEGLQLGYKLSANSLYGQCGASTSAIFKQDVAAGCTSTGRQMLNLCSSFAIQYYDCDIVYGDTDSVFCKYKSYSEDGVELEGKERLRYAIQKSILLEKDLNKYLRFPEAIEYEKCIFPFVLFSKKRYIGYLYETDWNIVPKLKYMGIVLKRRDNANIVKICYQGVITKLLEEKTIDSAVVFLKEKLEELVSGKINMKDLTITKTLRGYYKNPEGIAHKVLAERMGDRDPGNRPSSNDRIPYIFITVKERKGQKILQGDRIEHPDFIKENNIKIDYRFYIIYQIQRPIMQIFELCMKKPDEPFQAILNKLNRNLMGVKDISSYFK